MTGHACADLIGHNNKSWAVVIVTGTIETPTGPTPCWVMTVSTAADSDAGGNIHFVSWKVVACPFCGEPLTL